MVVFSAAFSSFPLLRLHRPNGVRVLSQCCMSTDEALLLCWQCKYTKNFPNYQIWCKFFYDELLTAVNFFGLSIGCPSPLFMGLLTICKNIRLKMGYFFCKNVVANIVIIVT
jgi:hypothetical protein